MLEAQLLFFFKDFSERNHQKLRRVIFPPRPKTFDSMGRIRECSEASRIASKNGKEKSLQSFTDGGSGETDLKVMKERRSIFKEKNSREILSFFWVALSRSHKHHPCSQITHVRNGIGECYLHETRV